MTESDYLINFTYDTRFLQRILCLFVVKNQIKNFKCSIFLPGFTHKSISLSMFAFSLRHSVGEYLFKKRSHTRRGGGGNIATQRRQWQHVRERETAAVFCPTARCESVSCVRFLTLNIAFLFQVQQRHYVRAGKERENIHKSIMKCLIKLPSYVHMARERESEGKNENLYSIHAYFTYINHH
jgi:hypothetical protein